MMRKCRMSDWCANTMMTMMIDVNRRDDGAGMCRAMQCWTTMMSGADVDDETATAMVMMMMMMVVVALLSRARRLLRCAGRCALVAGCCCCCCWNCKCSKVARWATVPDGAQYDSAQVRARTAAVGQCQQQRQLTRAAPGKRAGAPGKPGAGAGAGRAQATTCLAGLDGGSRAMATTASWQWLAAWATATTGGRGGRATGPDDGAR